MVPDKRTITAACGLLAAAALGLAACAPSGYGDGGSDDPAAAPALANATGSPEPDPSSSGAPAEEDSESESSEGNSDSDKNADVDFTTELTAKTLKRMGRAVANEEGFLLYLFTKDSKNPSKSNCDGECARIWPPALTDGNPTIEGISADLVGTVTRKDGTKQITINGWPAYTYYGDKAPGKWKGQGVGGTWFILGPDGKANKSCLPAVPPKPVAPPPADEEKSSEDGTSEGGGGYNY